MELSPQFEALTRFLEDRDYFRDELDFLVPFIREAIDDEINRAAEVHLKPNLRRKEYEALVKEMRTSNDLTWFR